MQHDPHAPTSEANMPEADGTAWPAWTEQDIRFNDVDMQGHVNNTVFPVYFEAGRLVLSRGPDCPPVPAGTGVVVAQVSIRYLASLTWPGTVRIGTRVAGIGNRSYTLSQVLLYGEQRVALCEAAIVCVDLATGKAIPLSAKRRAFLEKYR